MPAAITEMVQGKTLRRVHGIGTGFKRLVRKAFIEARRRRMNAVVVVADCDRRSERLREARESQEDHSFELPRALGVAVETFDAWMLADQVAISKALGKPIDKCKSPESLCGKENSGQHPKDVMMQITDATDGLADLYAAIAQHVNLDILASECPKGFAPFKERLQSLARLAEN